MWYYDQCDNALAAGLTVEAAYKDQADVLIGPACPTCKFIFKKSIFF